MANIFRQPCDEGAIRSAPAARPCKRAAEPWILAATILGSSMAFIDGTVVNVALPELQKSLNATVVDVTWVVESYALFLAALLLVGGSMGDRYGRRRIFRAGTALFALASVWCGAASGVEQLIIARAAQGVGGALLVPGSLAIISSAFDERGRGKAIGTWSGFTAITAAIGPVIGGWLIENVSWRAAFFINLPIAVVVLVISYLYVPETRAEENEKLDWPGAALATIGLGALVYGLIESSTLGFRDPLVASAIAGGAILLALFVVFEMRTPAPMLQLGLFRSRNFSGANLLTLFLYTPLSGSMFFVPLNLIQVQGFSATAAGAAWLPFILIIFLLSRWSGGLVDRFGAKLPLVIGPLIAAIGYGLFTLTGVGENYWRGFFPAVAVLGLGMAISVAPLTATVMGAVPVAHAGVASGVNNAVSRIAGLLGVAVFGIVMQHAFSSELDTRLAQLAVAPEVRSYVHEQRVRLAAADAPEGIERSTRSAIKTSINESFVHGFHVVTVTAMVLSLAAAASALMMIEGKPRTARAA